MSTYVIGDVQGCFSYLQKLLTEIKFDSAQDTLWFTGDLVNRGPQSLEVLRFIKNLPHTKVVLGNHDLHLLAVDAGVRLGSEDDTLQPIMVAPDRRELMQWLRQQPLLFYDEKWNYVMVHAGLAPAWDLAMSLRLAHEVEDVLRDSKRAADYLQNMYGNEPSIWSEELQGYDRFRCITNYFTRVRFCHYDGSMQLQAKGKINSQNDLIPWFRVQGRKSSELNILFGHWAALSGVTNTANVFALDTGCVWGYALTAMRLEDGSRFSVSCT